MKKRFTDRIILIHDMADLQSWHQQPLSQQCHVTFCIKMQYVFGTSFCLRFKHVRKKEVHNVNFRVLTVSNENTIPSVINKL